MHTKTHHDELTSTTEHAVVQPTQLAKNMPHHSVMLTPQTNKITAAFHQNNILPIVKAFTNIMPPRRKPSYE